MTQIPEFGNHFQGLITEMLGEVWPAGHSEQSFPIHDTVLKNAFFSVSVNLSYSDAYSEV